MGALEKEFVVVGGGPAGCSAALTAAGLGLSTLLIEATRVGGQLRSLPKLKNLAGTTCSGRTFIRTLEQQLESLGVPLLLERVRAVDPHRYGWQLTCENDLQVEASCVVIATGAQAASMYQHPSITVHPTGVKETFLETADFSSLRGHPWAIIGCDRPLVSRLEADPEEEAWSSATVFALSEKAYVLAGYDRPADLRFVSCSRIEIFGDRRGFSLATDGTDSDPAQEYQALVTCLGKQPASKLLAPFIPLDAYDYPERPPPFVGPNGAVMFWAGDVGHRAFQRVSVAIGEGASAALRWYYQRESLYGFGGSEITHVTS